MLNLLCLGKELEAQEMSERVLHAWESFRSRQGFLVATELSWFCVATGVPCVMTWFSGFK